MKIIIGTNNEKKKEILFNVVRNFIEGTIEVIGVNAPSGVPETPWDKETYVGAKNRALYCQLKDTNADYYVGLESGLVERYGAVYEEAWCCVIAKTKHFFGYSSGLRVPEYITSQMKNNNLEHNQVMRLLEEEGGIYKDTWANYSANSISREVSLEEAIRNTLLQVFAKEESLYRKT